MANSPEDALRNQRERASIDAKVEQDILDSDPVVAYPERIDWVAEQVAKEGKYIVMPDDSESITPPNFDSAVGDHYRRGIAAVRDEDADLLSEYPVGDVVYEYAKLANQLLKFQWRLSDENPTKRIDSGEVLGRIVARKAQRTDSGVEKSLAIDIEPETQLPRELVHQLATRPEIATAVEDTISNLDGKDLSEQIAEIDLVTELWDHQIEALTEWIRNDYRGYVDMATATGKTVLGLAAIALCTDSGSLHPSDQTEIASEIDSWSPPSVSNVLVVINDDLLRAQWSRLFQNHCYTPEEFTQAVEESIVFPWGSIDLRPVSGLDQTSPDEYDLVIFDEVHNYGDPKGWGEGLVTFIDSGVPMLALSGSIQEGFEKVLDQAEGKLSRVGDYSLPEARENGIIPTFDWSVKYVPLDADRSKTLDSLERTAEIWDSRVEVGTDGLLLQLSDEDTARLAELDADSLEPLRGTHDTASALAGSISEVIPEDKRKINRTTEELHALSKGIQNRRIHWWHLRPELDRMATIVGNALDEERPCLVLTKSYKEAEIVSEILGEHLDSARLDRLDGDQSTDQQEDIIKEFDADDDARKILVGPGGRIGTGIDIESVEVAVNLPKPGTGSNASLLQRLGRILRNPDDTDKQASFYHLLGVPEESALIEEDGATFVTNVCEFYEQASRTMEQTPSITVEESIEASVRSLEATGAKLLSHERTQSTLESEFVTAVQNRADTETTVTAQWGEHPDEKSAKDQDDNSTQPMNSTDSGVVEEDSLSEFTDGYKIDAIVLKAAQLMVADDGSDYDELESLVEDAVRDRLIADLSEREVTVSGTESGETARLEISLDRKLEQMVSATVGDGVHESADRFVETALREKLELDATSSEELSVQLPTDLKTTVEAVVSESGDYETMDEFVEGLLRRGLYSALSRE